MDFKEADRRYAEIERRKEAGELTQEEFDEQLKELMVQDEEGRWWVKSRTTGEWHYHDGTAWVKGKPPGYQGPLTDPEDQTEIQQSERLGAQELMHRVAAVYDQGLRCVDAGEWQQALERFEEVQRLEPGFRDTEELLSQVRQEFAPPPIAKVPDLSGQEVPQASSVLTSKGLRLGKHRKVPSDTVPEGRIIEQSPEAGKEVQTGSSLSVTVSSGPSTVEVPNLAGRSRSKAKSMLQALDLKCVIAESPSSTVGEGEIFDQEPTAQTQVKRGSRVQITVSSGTRKAAETDDSSQRTAETSKPEPAPSTTRSWSKHAMASRSRQGRQSSSPQRSSGDGSRAEAQLSQRSEGQLADAHPRPLLHTLALAWGALALRGLVLIIYGLWSFHPAFIDASLLTWSVLNIFVIADGVIAVIASRTADRISLLRIQGIISGAAGLTGLVCFLIGQFRVAYLVLALWAICLGSVYAFVALRLGWGLIVGRLMAIGGVLLVLYGGSVLFGLSESVYTPFWLQGSLPATSGVLIVIFALWSRKSEENS